MVSLPPHLDDSPGHGAMTLKASLDRAATTYLGAADVAKAIAEINTSGMCLGDLSELERSMPEDPNAILAYVAAMLSIAIAKCDGESEPSVIDPRLAGLVFGQMEQLRAKVLACLPRIEFKTHQQFEPSPKAGDCLEKCLDVERANIKKIDDKKGQIYPHLEAIFQYVAEQKGTCLTEMHTAALHGVAERLAKQRSVKQATLMEELTSNPVFKLPPISLKVNELRAAFATKEENLREIMSILKGQEGPSEAFRVLNQARAAYRTMDPQMLWERTRVANSVDLGPNTVKPDNLLILAILATELCAEIAPNFEMSPKVRAENDIGKLRAMALIVPINSEAFCVMQSALIKLEMMHILLMIISEADFKKTAAIGRYVKQYMDHLCAIYNGCNVFNYPTDSDGKALQTLDGSENHVYFDRVEIDEEGKSPESLGIKLIIDGLTSLKKIFDNSRGRMYCRYEDCYDENGEFSQEMFLKWVHHALGVFLSVFGDDIDEDRWRCSIITGGVNPDSTGKHRGIQLTVTLKHNVWENGINVSRSTPLPSTSMFEWQFLAWVSPEEARADHDVYKGVQSKLVSTKLGAEISFSDFISDLLLVLDTPNCDLKLAAKGKKFGTEKRLQNFINRRDRVADVDRFPEHVNVEKLLERGMVAINNRHDRIALIVMEILTTRKSENQNELREMLMNHRASLRRVVQRCAQWSEIYPESEFGTLIQQRASLVMHQIQQLDSGTISVGDFLRTENGANVESKLVFENGKGSSNKVIRLKKKTTIDGKTTDELHDWDGPIRQIVEVQPDGRRFFYDIHLNRKGIERRTLSYIIQDTDDGCQCFIVHDGAGKDTAPVWQAKICSNADGSVTSYNFYPFEYQFIRTNEGTIEVATNTSEKCIGTVPIDTEVRPHHGMDKHNARPYKLLEELYASRSGKPKRKK